MASPIDAFARGPFVYPHSAQERVVFNTPAADAVVAEADRLRATRVLVVSSRSLARMTDGPLQRVVRALGPRHVGTMDTMHAHTPREDVLAIADAARAGGADLIVAVGGGSVIDGCKAATMCVWHDIRDVGGMEPFLSRPPVAPADALRSICLSTTLSAADFTAAAGVTESTTKAKQLFRHPLFVPRTAILDPASTIDTPMDLLLSTGMRSVDHAVEGYCSLSGNPATDLHALQGLQLLHAALPAIAADPASLAARTQAQMGMWQAITAASAGAGSGASHGIGYALGATFDVAHGHTSCVMLPAVLRWNARVNADRQAVLSAVMGAPDTAAGDLVGALVRGLGLPATLRDLGIGRRHFDELAKRSLGYAPVKANPRPIRSEADVREILELAW